MTLPRLPSPAFKTLALLTLLLGSLMLLSAASAKTLTHYIVGGDVETGFPGVGAIIEDGEWSCTGSLIAPTVVLTAAHCLPNGTKAKDLTYFMGVDSNAPATGKTVAVKSVHTHPDNNPNAFDTADVGILILKEAVHDVPLLPVLNQAMDNSWIGTQALHIGFGLTSGFSQQGGVKHSVWIPISEVMPTGFGYDEANVNTCDGDSGGPALVDLDGTLTIIGVNSYGDEYCEEYGVNTRVDPYYDFIASFLPDDLDTTSPGGDGGGDDTMDPGDDDTTDPGDDDTTDPGDDTTDPGDDTTDPGDDTTDPTDPEPGDDTPWDDGDTTGGDGADWDPCEERGWYGDGVCDAKCPKPDPDCADGDLDALDCEAEGRFGDGVCDEDCASPDPDCGAWDQGDFPSGQDGCQATSAGQTPWMFAPFALMLAWQRRRLGCITG